MTKRQHAQAIIRKLKDAGFEAYLVGGCVRDLLRKKRAKDFDIATGADPETIAKLFKRTVAVGAKFGVMVVLEGDHSFEVATFRADQGYRDGRHPTSVRFTDAREDALRRDFTVNGLFYDPSTGKVMDWVGGRKDLRARLIRAIGTPSKRFDEDKLRMLRAVRFASVLGFRIEPATFAAIRRLAPGIKQVSGERVRDELVKMFTGPDPAGALTLLDRSGLLRQVLPEVARMKGVQQPKEFHPEGDVFVHTRMLLEQLHGAPADLAFGCLLHDVGKPPTFKRTDRIRFNGHDHVGARISERILERLRFPNDLRDRIVACVEGHMRFKDVRQMRESTLKQFMRRDTFGTELEQHRIDCLASHGDLTNWRFLKRKLREFSREDMRPAPLLSGRDVLALGYPEGPVVGRILKALEVAQLERQVSTREQAIDWISRHKEEF